MNYIINNIPINKNKGLGISIPFNGNTGFNTTYTTKDVVRNNLLNFLLTNKRERIFNPNFGANIRYQLFEKITDDNLMDLRDIIISGINYYFNNVKIDTLNITHQDNIVNIFFTYSILNTNIEDEININITNG